ncbi:pentapeptide repeat-containing protein [Krasilnikovia sp. MM14-A1004]|uniref:pentapeptide repeat-containing protein n=1 Tax=Krasilnikovia sp. MM14-A1004 TaxID=3373541 RepID=UPI00399D50D6
MSATPAKIKSRWRTSSGGRLAEEAVRRLRAGEALSGLGLEVVDGRFDLRGVTWAKAPAMWEDTVIEGIALDHADLRHLRFVDCELRNCRFAQANCQDWRLWGTTIEDCSFDHADLRGSSLGAWRDGRGNTFRRVRFVSADMASVGTSAATYVDCDFSFADLTRVNFWQSTLAGCIFAGELVDVVFDGRMLGEEKPDPNPMKNVDFANAKFDGVDFRGVNFATVTLPDDPDLLRVDDLAIIDRATSVLASRPRDAASGLASAIFQQVRRFHSSGASILLNRRDFEPAAALITDVLREAGWAPHHP